MIDWRAELCRLIEERTGILLSGSITDRAETFVRARCRELGLAGESAYLDTLGRPRGAAELESLINLITVGKTGLFRYPEQIAAVVDELLPVLDRLLPAGEPVRLWSVGCSSGEEAYSLAIALDAAAWFARRPIQLVASDINTQRLQVARHGRYHLDEATRERLPPEAWSRLRRDGDRFAVADELRARVAFCRVNLLAPHELLPGGWHVVLCCNVLIYFAVPTRVRVLEALCERLAPDAALLLGGTESILQAPGDLTLAQLSGGTYSLVRGGCQRELSRRCPAEGPVAAATTSTPPRSSTDAAAPAAPSMVLAPRAEPAAAAPMGAGASPSPPALKVPHAVELLESGRVDEACTALEDAALATPLVFEIHFLHGKALAALGRFDEAEHAFRRALFLEPAFFYAHYELGRCLHAGGSFQLAVQCYDRALRSASSKERKWTSGAARLLRSFDRHETFVLYLCETNRLRALANSPPLDGSGATQ